jgi:hypothetical protein
MTTHVLSGLMTRRSEIAELIAEKRAEIRHMMITLEHIDATIREFQPDAELENVDKKGTRPDTWAGRGEALKIILNILRLAEKPMGTMDIAKEVMRQRGMSLHDKRMVRVVTRRVCATLRAQRDQGRVQSSGERGQQAWDVVR